MQKLTKSRTLLSQMVGRALRVYPNKKYCNIVEDAPLYGSNDYVRTELIVKPDQKFISTMTGISECRTREVK